jgi:hypothetical protein
MSEAGIKTGEDDGMQERSCVGCRADNIGRVICVPMERLAYPQEDAMRAVLCPRPLLTEEGLLRLYSRMGTGVCWVGRRGFAEEARTDGGCQK